MKGAVDPAAVRLSNVPSHRTVVSYLLKKDEGPNGGVLLKVALLGSEDERYYLSPVGVITVIYCCERHIRGMAGPPGYASALQWFKSREPKISQEDFDSITDKDVVVNIAALKKERVLVLELERRGGKRRALTFPTDFVFRLLAELGQIEARRPRPPGASTH